MRELRNFKYEHVNAEDVFETLGKSLGNWKFERFDSDGVGGAIYSHYQYVGKLLPPSSAHLVYRRHQISLANIIPSRESGKHELTDYEFNALADSFVSDYRLGEIGFLIEGISLDLVGVHQERIGNLRHVSQLATSLGNKPVFFRGQGDEKWDISPSLLVNFPLKAPQYKTKRDDLYGIYELMARIEQVLAWERKLFREFLARIGGFFCALESRTIFDQVAIARHFNVPTRLVDWTHDFRVALFFTCADCPSNDGCLWVATPSEDDVITRDKVNLFPTKAVRHLDRDDKARVVFVTDSTPLTLNHASQRGLFSVHPIERTDYQPINRVLDPKKFRRLVVPKEGSESRNLVGS